MKFKKRKYKLRKGLTRMQAALILSKRQKHDFRGMKYDPKTGIAIIV
jgi:hypothetical protein